MRDEDRIRRMAKYFTCPVIVAAQARELKHGDKQLAMPTFYDVQETTYVSQHTDRLYAIALPKMSGRIGEFIDYGNAQIMVGENQLWIKCEKQKRYKDVGSSFPLLIQDNGNVILDSKLFDQIKRLERKV